MRNDMPLQSNLITTADAADLLGVNVATVNKWAACGRVTPVFQNQGRTGFRLYMRKDIEELAHGRNRTHRERADRIEREGQS